MEMLRWLMVVLLVPASLAADPPPLEWVRDPAIQIPVPDGLTGSALAMDAQGRLWVIAGCNDVGAENLEKSTVLRFDPSTRLWTQLPDLQVPRIHPAAAVDRHGRVIVIGGAQNYSTPDPGRALSSVEAYDEATGSWSFLSPMPQPRLGARAVASPDGSSILVFGGRDADPVSAQSTAWLYDVDSDTWSDVAPMSYRRLGHGGVQGPDGRVYAIGGWGGGPGDPDSTGGTVERYDWTSRAWETLPGRMLVHPHLVGAAAADGCRYIYACGGWDPGYSAQVERLDVWTGTWEACTPLLSARNNMVAAVDRHGRLFLAGGDDGFQPTRIVDHAVVWRDAARLTFDAPAPGTILDRNGDGTGWTHRLPGTLDISGADPNLDLRARPGTLRLTSVPTSAGVGQPRECDAPGILLPGIGSSDFSVTATFDDVHTPEPSDQLWIYVGSSSERLVVFGFHNDRGFSVWGNEREYDVTAWVDGAVVYRWVSMMGAQAYLDGDRVALGLSRSGGLWQLCWTNHTDPAKSGCSPWLALDYLDGEEDLYVGVYYSNPRNETPDQSYVEDFRVSACSSWRGPPILSVPDATLVDCRTAVPLYLEIAERARAFSLSLTYPRQVARLLEVRPGAAFGALGAPDIWEVDMGPPACEPGLTAATLGCVISLGGSRELPSGRHEVALLVFERSLADPETGCIHDGAIEFRDACVGDPPVSLVVVTRDGDVVPETRTGVLLPGASCFLRGDADSSGRLTIGDAVATIYHLFRDEPVLCLDALDTDDDGELTVTDAIDVIGYLFRHWSPPPAPFPSPGPDPTPDPLSCDSCE